MQDQGQIQPGEIIGGSWAIERTLGEGGMGIVVQARHTVTAHRVAIKLLLASAEANPDIVRRFQLEASAANRIPHDGFVKPIHFGVHNSKPFLVMEYLDGVTLADEIHKRGPMHVDRAARILDQVADALFAAHEAGIIHRDIKPENIFLLSNGQVKLLDLGIAKFVRESGSTKTRTGQPIGTPFTMSPEQCLGVGIDHRSDIYALAVVAFFMCSGRYPFQSPGFGELLAMHIQDDPPRLSSVQRSVPIKFSEFLYRNMAKEAAKRARSMKEFANVMHGFATGTTREDRSASTRRVALFAASFLLALALGAIALVFSLNLRRANHRGSLPATAQPPTEMTTKIEQRQSSPSTNATSSPPAQVDVPHPATSPHADNHRRQAATGQRISRKPAITTRESTKADPIKSDLITPKHLDDN